MLICNLKWFCSNMLFSKHMTTGTCTHTCQLSRFFRESTDFEPILPLVYRYIFYPQFLPIFKKSGIFTVFALNNTVFPVKEKMAVHCLSVDTCLLPLITGNQQGVNCATSDYWDCNCFRFSLAGFINRDRHARCGNFRNTH